MIAKYDGSTGAVNSEYFYSGSRMIAKVSSGVTQYFLSDRLSTRLVLDTSGNVLGRQGHLPFGEDFAESGTQDKHHFTNYERDGESGTDYAVNRQYAPSVGRFTRVDPYRGGANLDPQSWSRYSYVQNAPIDFIDPVGLLRYNPPGPTAGLPGSGPLTGNGPGDPPINPGGGGGGGSREASCSRAVTTDTAAGSDETPKVYNCFRPLKSGIPQLPVGPTVAAVHQYICVKDKDGTKCVGLNPSGSIYGSPGQNNPSDGYDPKKCKEVSSDPCFASCVQRKFKEFDEKPPEYKYPEYHCQTWAKEVLQGCKKECKQ